MQSIDENTRKLNRLTKAVRGSLADFQRFEIDTKVELIRALIALGLMAVGDMLEAEVVELAGSRYRRGGEHRRHGSNPGTVKLQGQRHRMRVPRVRDRHGNEVGLQGWAGLRGDGRARRGAATPGALRAVLPKITPRRPRHCRGRSGCPGSTVSRNFIEASQAKLKTFRERDLSKLDLVALFLDGKTFAEDMLVVALGVTMDGRKVVLDFVADRDRERTRAHALPGWCGGSGRGALPRAAGHYRWGQRAARSGANGVRQNKLWCNGASGTSARMWVSYLAKNQQPIWRRRLQHAYERATYEEANKPPGADPQGAHSA